MSMRKKLEELLIDLTYDMDCIGEEQQIIEDLRELSNNDILDLIRVELDARGVIV